MTELLKNPVFNDETKAREWLEARVWPNGPVCPHCGNVDQTKLKALEGKAHRPGVYQCAECRDQFTVTVKTVFERSKIPLTKWLAALFLMTASKKGVSAHQVHRMLGISYKSTWFMMHRLREAMRTGGLAPMGGEGKTVEADETYIGKIKGMPKPRGGSAHKNMVLTLVERGGSARSFHNILSPRKPLPPLLAGTAYVAADFEAFDYSGGALTGSKPILHLNLKNGTTIDLPTTDDELKHLLVVLCEAFPKQASDCVKSRWP